MARPRKDPSAAPKEKTAQRFRVPVGPGRFVTIIVPIDGLEFDEVELLETFLAVLRKPGQGKDPRQRDVFEDEE